MQEEAQAEKEKYAACQDEIEVEKTRCWMRRVRVHVRKDAS